MIATDSVNPNPGPASRARSWVSQQVDSFLNWLFALHDSSASMRSLLTSLFFLLAYILSIVFNHSAEEWVTLFNIWIGLEPVKETTILPIPLDILANTLLAPAVLARMIALAIPFWFMTDMAAVYLADIFEKEFDVAKTFLGQAAFGGYYNTIRISNGKIAEEHLESPIVQIGGPGYLLVELDSAVLIETPEGEARIIRPSGGEWRNRAVIDGFERIRQCFDLRDISGSQDIVARSRDGIPITAKNVQYTFSVYRGGESVKKTLPVPYPFDDDVIKKLVYGEVRPVSPDKVPERKPDWATTKPGNIYSNINNELGGFISKRGLSEFFSTIGAPEEEAFNKMEENIRKSGQEISGIGSSNGGSQPLKAGDFTARSLITKLFYDDKGFRKVLKNKGLQLNWIGIGTWDTPHEIIPARHMEAWKISRENFIRKHPDELEKLETEARLNEITRLIQQVIEKWYRLKGTSDEEFIDLMLDEYHEKLEAALGTYEREGQDPPRNLIDALYALNQVRGIRAHNLEPDEGVG